MPEIVPFITARLLSLQVGGRSSELIATGLLAYELVGAVLGVVIAYLAYRGYQRNDSRPMLFVALGFVLALGVPLVLTLLYVALPFAGGQVMMQIVIQTVEIIGLLCIIYGLRI